MSISQQLTADLPFLRRYARALTGSQDKGDALVRTLLERVLADETLKNSLQGGRIALYRVFHSVLSDNSVETQGDSDAMDSKEKAAANKLDAIAPSNRQALLLTTVEDFTPAQAGQIMDLESAEVQRLVAEAVQEIDEEQKTSVLIIEDEPMIQMQLEDLVGSLGHEVCGTATTRTEAVRAVAEKRPGLILADIQLADGSSGLDAVEDILQLGSVPVVFVTAYPERLLTGDRIEPTYLVTKPFREQTVKASISQALFFG